MAKDDPFGDIYKADADNPFGDIYKSEPSVAWDVAKQIPSGLAAGVAAIPAAPAHIASLLGSALSEPITRAVEYFSPAKAQEMRAAEKQRLENVAALQSKYGTLESKVGELLPQPQTTAGQFARRGAEFVPSVVAGSRLAVPRAVGVGATTGLVSEAAGQGAEALDPSLAPYARGAGALVAGAVAGPAAAGAEARAAVRRSIAATEAAGDRGFNAFRASGFALDPAAATTYTTPLKTDLASRGLTPRTAERTWDVLNDIERNPYTSPVQFQDRYKELGSVARKSTDSEERLAANIAQQRLLQSLENPPPWVVQGGDPAAGAAILREANANWAAAQRAKNVDKRIAAAELKAGSTYSGLNLENQLRQRVGVLADPSVRGGFSSAEQEAFRKFAEGTPVSNVRRYARNLLGGGGGLGALAAGGTGAAIGGQYFGLDPLTYGGVATLGGLGLAKFSNLAALNRARELQLMLLQRSPQGGAGIPRSGVPYSLAAPTLATIGENYQE
jgi:hypothetical protein